VNSWLDRDLGLSGRVAVRDVGEAEGFRIELVRIDEPLLRVPQLAIHLDREINERGLQLNKQQHLVPVWGLGARRPGEVVELVAERIGVAWHEILGWDLMLHDLTPSTIGGVSRELVFAPRLDNLLSCHAAITALSRVVDEVRDHVAVVLAQKRRQVKSLFTKEGSLKVTGEWVHLKQWRMARRIVTFRMLKTILKNLFLKVFPGGCRTKGSFQKYSIS
jgi:aspartyl aminopeptidase